MGKKDRKRRPNKKIQKTPPACPTAAPPIIDAQQAVHPSSDTPHSLSLGSQLKRQRGTAQSTPLPPEWTGSTTKPFLSPSDGTDFTSCLQQCYRGFTWETPDQWPDTFHTTFKHTLEALHDLFLYDAVQPGGTKVSKTFVKRTLIGKPGSTYRYLGLRLFSHPWCPTTDNGDACTDTTINIDAAQSLIQLGYNPACAAALLQMGHLNQLLVHRTQQLLQRDVVPHVGLVGPADFTLTLVNRMEPTSVKKHLKAETTYGMGKTSVSWHKDSGLTDFSSIAVYHTLYPIDDKQDEPSEEWRTALRVATPTTATKTPPLLVPLPSGAVYYLLDDFNHNHEHAVLAGGNQLRYSSTHRVAREGRGTWQYIRDKCQQYCVKVQQTNNKQELVKLTRAQLQLLTEVEFEWLRQWYIQGSLHASLHAYWHTPIALLEQYYQQLESLVAETMLLLQHAASSSFVSLDLFDVFIESFEERSKAREAWRDRLLDPIFHTMSQSTKPIQQDTVFHGHALLQDCKLGLEQLRIWRTAYVSKNHQTKTLSTRGAELTKKEKRKVASNWEQMKAADKKQNKKRKLAK